MTAGRSLWWDVIQGDCRVEMRGLPEELAAAVITDPPYELGFMGKDWDKAGVSFDPATWREVWRTLKPGSHLVAFGGSRTFHRIAVAIEDAGFEIRDVLSWMYGQGSPKSMDVSKAIDKSAGAERECTRQGEVQRDGYGEDWDTGSSKDRPRFDNPATAAAAAVWSGWGTALKPAWEPIILARKPLGEKTVAANVLLHGTGALNIDGARIETEDGKNRARPPRTANALYGGGNGTNLTASEHNDLGRWPANVLLDEVAAQELDKQSGVTKSNVRPPTGRDDRGVPGFVMRREDTKERGHNDSGGASRFFYVAKASKSERNAGLPDGEVNGHPTVKPVALMRWLCRLVTPSGGLILDPFCGSGTTGRAAIEEGFEFLGIEQDAANAELCRARIGSAQPQAAVA